MRGWLWKERGFAVLLGMAVATSAFVAQTARAEDSSHATAAQPPDNDTAAEPAGYRELIDEALRESEAKNYEEALALFLRANAVFPNARTHRGIAMTEFELRNYPACITEIEVALSSTVRPLDAQLRADAQRLLARAKNFVGRLVIETRPAAFELRVDGRPLSEAERAEPALVVKLGEHLVEAHAHGYAPEKRQVSAKGGETTTLTILFTRPTDGASETAERRHWHKSPWLWTAAGALVAGTVTASVLATRDRGPTPAATDAYVVTQ